MASRARYMVVTRLQGHGVDVIAKVKELDDDQANIVLYRPDTSRQYKFPPQRVVTGERLGGDDIDALVEKNLELLTESGFFGAARGGAGGQSSTESSEDGVLIMFEELAVLQDRIRRSDFLSAPGGSTTNQLILQDAIEAAKSLVSLARKLLHRIKRRHGDADDAEPKARLLGNICEAYNAMGSSWTALGKYNKALTCFVLAAKVVPGDASALQGIKSELERQDPKLEQQVVNSRLQEMLADYEMKSLDDPVSFSCTSCGECCRSADNIFLTPLDLYRMSRAPSLSAIGVTTTRTLIEHPRFSKAFNFVLKDGVAPVCYLSPVKGEQGHCHFAYQLYREEVSGKILSVGDAWTLETASETVFAGEDADLVRGDQVVLNSYGRPALGCSLGPLHMPTICASFPIAPELSVADFWHTRKATSELSGGSVLTGWFTEESFVSVKNHGCEGFAAAAAAAAEGAALKTPLMGKGLEIVYQRDPCSDKDRLEQRTVRDFLTEGDARDGTATRDEKWQLIDRMEENAWFANLIRELILFLPEEDFDNAGGGEKKHYVRVLAKIFFNFDALKSSVTRPIKSWKRVKMDIESLSWALAKSTKEFLMQEGGGEEEEYVHLLHRLGFTN